MNNLVPFLLFAIASTVTPGPNNFMIMNSGLQFGVKNSLGHYFGICLGFPIMVLIIALGFGNLFVAYPWIETNLKILGSIYMLYLAYQIMTSSSKSNNERVNPFNFYKALLFQWVNPKAWIMGIGAIAIFTLYPDVVKNAMALSFIFFLICLPGTGIWLVFGSLMQKVLKQDKHRRWFNFVMAVCLVASIGMIYFE